MLCLDDCFATTTMPQPTEITQFIFGQPLKKQNREIPDAVWGQFTGICAEEMKRSLPELEEPIIAIYDANFSADEIKQLVAFYQSPVGRKIVIQLPQLMQQSVSMGQSWGQQAGARAVERIRALAKQKGYDL